MKTIGAALKTHLAGELTTVSTCVLITRTDGVVFSFTDHDQPLVIGGVTYQPALSFSRSAIRSTSDNSVDNLEAEGVLDAAAITDSDLQAGKFDDATIVIFLVNWADLTQGTMTLRRGQLGKVTLQQNRYQAEVRGLMQFLNTTVGETYQPTCRADLYDSRCKVPIDGGTAALFDGATGYIDAGDPAAFQISAVTLEAWIKTSASHAGDQVIIGKGSAWMLGLHGNVPTAYDSATSFVEGSAVNDGKEHHVALVFAPGVTNGSRIYVDGAAVGSAFTTASPSSQASPVRIGASALPDEFFDGIIGRAALYSGALSSSRIAAHAACTTDFDYDAAVMADSPLGYWKLSDRAGSTALDKTAGANNGTVAGTVTFVQPGPFGYTLADFRFNDSVASVTSARVFVASTLANPGPVVKTYTASTISFHKARTLSDSANGFVAAGFAVNDAIEVTGSAKNDRPILAAAVAAGTITTGPTDTGVLNEPAGNPITLKSTVLGYFDLGYITWLTGANAGLKSEVLSWSGPSTKIVTLWLAPPYAIAPGDTFQIVPGCDHRVQTCAFKFANVLNFRGEPTAPGQDSLWQYPNATG